MNNRKTYAVSTVCFFIVSLLAVVFLIGGCVHAGTGEETRAPSSPTEENGTFVDKAAHEMPSTLKQQEVPTESPKLLPFSPSVTNLPRHTSPQDVHEGQSTTSQVRLRETLTTKTTFATTRAYHQATTPRQPFPPTNSSQHPVSTTQSFVRTTSTTTRTTTFPETSHIPTSATTAHRETTPRDKYIEYSKGRFFVPNIPGHIDIDMPLEQCETYRAQRVVDSGKVALFDGFASGLGDVFCGHRQLGMGSLKFCEPGQIVYADGTAYRITKTQTALNDGKYLTDYVTGERIITSQPIAYTCAPTVIYHEYEGKQIPQFLDLVFVVHLEEI